MGARKLSLKTEKQQYKVFMQILDMLNELNDAEKRHLAEQAEVHWVTLYNWCGGFVATPRLDKLINVAEALGYDVELVRRQAKPTLRRVK